MRYGSYKVMRVGSCATRSREPSQVRKEAALSGPSRVPQGCLTRAEDEYDLMAPVSTAGARSSLFARSLRAGIPGSRPFARWRVTRSLRSARRRVRRPSRSLANGSDLYVSVPFRNLLRTRRAGGLARLGVAPLRSPRGPGGAGGCGDRARAFRCSGRRACGDGHVAVAGARHERRRREGARHRRAGDRRCASWRTSTSRWSRRPRTRAGRATARRPTQRRSATSKSKTASGYPPWP